MLVRCPPIGLVACCEDALAEVDVLKHTTTQLEASIVDKERVIQRRVQAVREEEWQKLHKVESEKYVK